MGCRRGRVRRVPRGDGLNLGQASKSTADDLTSLEKLFQTWKQGLFGVLFVMSNDASESKYMAWFIVLFHQLQVRAEGDARL